MLDIIGQNRGKTQKQAEISRGKALFFDISRYTEKRRQKAGKSGAPPARSSIFIAQKLYFNFHIKAKKILQSVRNRSDCALGWTQWETIHTELLHQWFEIFESRGRASNHARSRRCSRGWGFPLLNKHKTASAGGAAYSTEARPNSSGREKRDGGQSPGNQTGGGRSSPIQSVWRHFRWWNKQKMTNIKVAGKWRREFRRLGKRDCIQIMRICRESFREPVTRRNGECMRDRQQSWEDVAAWVGNGERGRQGIAWGKSRPTPNINQHASYFANEKRWGTCSPDWPINIIVDDWFLQIYM